MSSVLIIISMCFLLGLRFITCYTIDCAQMNCKNAFINCSINGDCNIECHGTKACTKSTINCPINGDCNIECAGTNACLYTTINAALSKGNLNILCTYDYFQNIESVQYCKGIKIFGSQVYSHLKLPHQSTNSIISAANVNIHCHGHSDSCIDSQIVCPQHSNCSIQCLAPQSCKNAYITGPAQGNLNIECDSDISCYNSTFNAVLSNMFNLKGCTEPKACMDITVYCPPHTDGHKNCYIQGNDNLGSDISIQIPTKEPTQIPTMPTLIPTQYTSMPSVSPTHNPTNMPTLRPTNMPTFPQQNGIKIYAINGWDDIDMDYNGIYGPTHTGRMYCGNTYESVCSLAKTEWKCLQSEHICDGLSVVGTTAIPTLEPTVVQRSFVHTNEGTETETEIETAKPTRIDIIKHSNSGQSNETSTINRIYRTQMNGDMFIIIGISIVIMTCCAVGYAQIRKNIADARQLTDMYGQKSVEIQKQKLNKVSRHKYQRSISIKGRRIQKLSFLSASGTDREIEIDSMQL